jgi:hypothetical protein
MFCLIDKLFCFFLTDNVNNYTYMYLSSHSIRCLFQMLLMFCSFHLSRFLVLCVSAFFTDYWLKTHDKINTFVFRYHMTE